MALSCCCRLCANISHATGGFATAKGESRKRQQWERKLQQQSKFLSPSSHTHSLSLRSPKLRVCVCVGAESMSKLLSRPRRLQRTKAVMRGRKTERETEIETKSWEETFACWENNKGNRQTLGPISAWFRFTQIRNISCDSKDLCSHSWLARSLL